jgi:hypothetical protein
MEIKMDKEVTAVSLITADDALDYVNEWLQCDYISSDNLYKLKRLLCNSCEDDESNLLQVVRKMVYLTYIEKLLKKERVK